jgi:two-component system, OmpR family, phosphate regulon response regulator PhoB
MLAAGLQKQILIVDRDVATVEPLRQKLSESGFVVRAITDGAAALNAVKERPPHLVVIDWNIPGYGALEVIQSVRGIRVPQAIRLIILSSLSAEHDIVRGLEAGADDYIAKPFSLRETVARISVLLRSHPFRRETGGPSDSLMLDSIAHRVTAQGMALNLRGAEFRLLEFLMSHPGRAFNRTQLVAHVWGGDGDVDERTVDVNVQRLRKILEQPGFGACIQTVRGFGYRFVGMSP